MENRHVSFHIVVFIATVTIATLGSVAEQPRVGSFKKVQCLTATCTTIRQYLAKNRMSCLTGCGQSATCYGVRWNASRECAELHLNCFTGSTAPCVATTAVNVTLYKKTFTRCQNNSTWVGVSVGCQCVDCWVGYYCERYPRNCSELATYNYPLKSLKCVLDHYGDARAQGTTVCSRASSTLIFTGLGWVNNSTLHNRTWGDYENGYFLSKKDFFVGLKHILILNQLGLTTVRAQVDYVHPVKNVSWTMFHENFNFRMGNASSGYSFTADTSSTYYTDYVKNTIMKNYVLADVISLSAGFRSPRSTETMTTCSLRIAAPWPGRAGGSRTAPTSLTLSAPPPRGESPGSTCLTRKLLVPTKDSSFTSPITYDRQ